MMMDHFDRLITDIEEEKAFGAVVEIGSNDGLFLNHCQNRGASYVLGVDPARNLAHIAEEHGIHTVCGFFTKGEIPDLIGASALTQRWLWRGSVLPCGRLERIRSRLGSVDDAADLGVHRSAVCG